MAKGRKKSHKKSKSKARGKTIASHGFGGRKFGCYGKHVKSGKGSKRVARIFCARTDA